uniref:Tetratricopeptide repeat protein n=1 Tax=uncultured myxobacterium HF0130_06F04 TaxID=723555 RepID=E7C2F2_9BACT|nr:hypothetical protein [uncultured myxobacterium HF0130_06F04]
MRLVHIRPKIIQMSMLGFTLLAGSPVYAAVDADLGEENALVEYQTVADGLRQLGVALGTLVKEYEDVRVIRGDRTFSERFQDAETLFLLKDYQRASLALYGLVNDAVNKSEPDYGKAVFYMAESQFQTNNLVAARKYFEKVVSQSIDPYVVGALKRLVEIADRRHQWDGLEGYLEKLQARGSLPAATIYATVKSLLGQDQPKAALKLAREVSDKHELYAKIKYMAAVAQVQLGKLDDALQRFQQLTQLEGNYEALSEIRELSHLNQGRIYLEQGKLTASQDAYQNIARSSQFFEQAMYEATWVHIRGAALAGDDYQRVAEYQKALNALEILLVGVSDEKIGSEARILVGNIYLWMGRHMEASEAFEEVVERYQAIYDELTMVQSRMVDPVEYYEEISIRRQRGGGNLPEIAVAWATDGGELHNAMGIVGDLDQAQAMVDDSAELVDGMLKMLDSQEVPDFFPGLQSAKARVLEIENQLVSFTERLLAVERRLVIEQLSPARKRELERVLAERAKLEPAYQQLPKTEEEYQGRRGEVRFEYQKVQKSVFRIKWSLEEQRRELVALRQWVNSHPESLGFSEEAMFRSRLMQTEQELKEMEVLQKTLESEITRERNLVSVSSSSAEEDELRARYGATLEREREILRVGQMFLVAAKLSSEEGQGMASPELVSLIKERRKLDTAKVEVQERLRTARSDIAASRWDLMDQKREIARIYKWMANNPNFLPEAEATEFRAKVAKLELEIGILVKNQDGLETKLVSNNTLEDVLAKITAREEALKQRYDAVFDKERQKIASQLAEGSSGGLGLVLSIQQSRELAARYSQDLGSFRNNLKSLTAAKAKEMKIQLLRERRAIEAQGKALVLAKGKAQRVIGEITMASVGGVQRRFQDIVMRGDVGRLDVAWSLKEKQTQEINAKLAAQRDEVSKLRSQFKSVMDE